MNFKGISYVKWNYLSGIEYTSKGIEKIQRDFLFKIEGEFNLWVNYFFGPIHFKGISYVNLTLSPKSKIEGKILKGFLM